MLPPRLQKECRMATSIKLEQLLGKNARKLKTLQFAVYLPESGFSYEYSSTGKAKQRFHSASVGKLFTATLIFMAAEQGRLSLDDTAAGILGADILNGLFTVNGKDCRDEVNIRHLLGHTSGINDYFGFADARSPFIRHIINAPDTFWTPAALLDYTRQRQQAVGMPGERFFYSDTGYILLGLIAEKAFGLPFHRVLEAQIFQTCGMADTDLAFYGQGYAAADLAPLYLGGTDIRLYQSLSCDFSGGGLSTTAQDLTAFLHHLHRHRLLTPASLRQMADFKHKYRAGLHYGLGMMQVRFKEFFFLLRGLPDLHGHSGASGTHAYFDPQTGGCFALNVGNTADMAKSFRLLTGILQCLKSEGLL